MIDFYREKYTNYSEFGMLKSITYFADADLMPQPKMFSNFDWELCKNKIRKEFNTLQL